MNQNQAQNDINLKNSESKVIKLTSHVERLNLMLKEKNGTIFKKQRNIIQTSGFFSPIQTLIPSFSSPVNINPFKNFSSPLILDLL